MKEESPEQKFENGRNCAILEFYEAVKRSPYRRYGLLLDEIKEKYDWLANHKGAISSKWIMGFYSEIHYMIWKSKEGQLKVNEEILKQIN